MRMNYLLALGLVGMIGTASLAGCTSSQTTAETPATSAATQASTGDTSGLKQVVTNTKAAVEAGDFNKAKTEFEQFETAWKPIEDGIKAKSPTGYDEIESGMDKVGSALNSADKTQALASLQSLDQAIASVAP